MSSGGQHISVEAQEKATAWLAQTLATDQRPVTFRELARETGCHVHTAKNLLRDYFTSHPDVSPTFLVSGPLLAHSSLGHTSLSQQEAPTATQSLAHMSATQKVRIVNMDEVSDDERNSEADGDEERVEELEASTAAIEEDAESLQRNGHGMEVSRWGVVLVGPDGLSEKRKLFDDDTQVHIYALTPVPVTDPALFLSSAFGLRKRANYMNPAHGSIVGETLAATAKPMRDGAIDFAKRSTGDKPQPSRKDTLSPPAKEADTKKPSAAKEESAKPTKATTKSKRRIIASDDEEEEESPPAPATRAAPLQPTSSMVRAEDQAAMEAMMNMDVELDDDGDASPRAAKTQSKPTSKDGKKRKRRQVKKSKTEMDAKGYMVTKDYFTDESYSGSETDTEEKPAPTQKADSNRRAPSKEQSRASSNASESKAAPSRPAVAKAPAKKASMGQSTLAGFFKKK